MSYSNDPKKDWDSLWLQLSSGLSKNPGRKYRHDLIRRSLSKLQISSTSTILDIGCGTGDLLEYLVSDSEFTDCIGVDVSEVGIKIAREAHPNILFALLGLDGDEPFCHEIVKEIDVAICSEVLEHLNDPKITLKWVSKILVPRGHLIITVPAGPMSFLEKYIGHRRHYTKLELETLLNEAGYEAVSIVRSGFPGINLIRLASIIRGKSIIKDLTVSGNSRKSVDIGIRILSYILKYSFYDSRFGWQLVAIARKRQVLI